MFFILSKILFFLINPILWIICLLGLALIYRKKSKKLILFLTLAGSILLVFSNIALYKIVAEKWEIKPLPTQSVKSKYQYAIVLGGMASKNPQTGKLHLGTSIDRILTAIMLYKEGKIEKILITGGSGLLLGKNQKEAPFMRDFCTQLGVMENDIVIESNSRNTYENAAFTKQIIGTPTENVLLITSATHMRRSIGCFEKQGFHFDILATDPSTHPILYFDDYFIPNGEPLMRWTPLMKEIIGFYTYKLAGYI